jgi:hypothetical protein
VGIVKGKQHEQATTTIQRGIQTGNRTGRHPGREERGGNLRERGIRDTLYYKWRDAFKARAPEIFVRAAQQADQVSQLEARVAELERLAGKLALENEILKKATSWPDGAARRNGRCLTL